MKPETYGQKGVAAVEFAFVLIPLMLILCGIIDFSLLLYDKAVITNASREGARYGIVYNEPSRPSVGEIQTKVLNYLTNNPLIDAGKTSPTANDISVTGAQGASGSDLTVMVSYSYDYFVIAHFIPVLDNPKTISARTVMRLE